MTTLFVYRQDIEFMGKVGRHITFSENPPDEVTLSDATCMGTIQLQDLNHTLSNDD